MSTWPMRIDVVVPGKFYVFARTPHSALKIVVFPVFGLPRRAMRLPGEAAGTLAAGAVGLMESVRLRRAIGNHEDPARDRSREADPSRAYLNDEGLPVLADAQVRGVDQSKRPQERTGVGIEFRAMKARLGSGL
jgi:hypothetical protein